MTLILVYNELIYCCHIMHHSHAAWWPVATNMNKAISLTNNHRPRWTMDEQHGSKLLFHSLMHHLPKINTKKLSVINTIIGHGYEVRWEIAEPNMYKTLSIQLHLSNCKLCNGIAWEVYDRYPNNINILLFTVIHQVNLLVQGTVFVCKIQAITNQIKVL